MRIFQSAEHLPHTPDDDEGTRGCDREPVSLVGYELVWTQTVAVMMNISLSSTPVLKRVGVTTNGARSQRNVFSFIFHYVAASLLNKIEPLPLQCGATPCFDFAKAMYFLYRDLSCGRCQRQR